MCKEYINIQTGDKLNSDVIKELPSNAMLKVRPDLWRIWNFEKNDELGFDIWKMKKGSGKKAWWICDECESKYLSIVNQKASNYLNCPYCTGKKVNDTNSLAKVKPELASQWHPTKNGDLTPNDIVCGSSKKAWWLGKCGHEWERPVVFRSQGLGCPYCANKKVLKGFNDMWTTRPDMASMLADPEDGYTHMQFSNKELNWKCPNCNLIIKRKIPYVNMRGLRCSECDIKSRNNKS